LLFFTGRATGEELQRELVRGVRGAWGVGVYGLGCFFWRAAETRDGLECSMHFFAESEKVQHIKID